MLKKLTRTHRVVIVAAGALAGASVVAAVTVGGSGEPDLTPAQQRAAEREAERGVTGEVTVAVADPADMRAAQPRPEKLPPLIAADATARTP